MERKIGEIFEYNGEWYQCVVAIQGCRECSFRTHDYCTHHLECLLNTRSDRTSVIFKKLEKVGEPYTTSNDKVMQNYLIETEVSEYPRDIFILTNYEQRIIAIEIKQTKEDMEEKNNAKHSNSEKIGKNLKPFSLEAAKLGKPVCTRDGRKARIICFDRINDYRIIACVTEPDGDFEQVLFYNDEGYIVDSQRPKGEDLMMLTEKKEGWVNVYNADTTFYYVDGMVYNTKDEAIQKAKEEITTEQREKSEYVDTVKISWEE